MHETLRELRLADRTVDLAACEVRTSAGALPLTTTEVTLLRFLGARPGVTLTRDELLQAVWNYKPGLKTRAVDYAVWRLRQKLESDPSSPRSLVSVHGVGYRLDLLEEGGIVGRGADLRRVRALLDDGASWVTLTGPGGIGKTSLVRVLAEERGIPMIPLAAAHDRPSALRTLVAELGLSAEGASEALVPAIGDALASRGRVALDNVEQVAEVLLDDLARWVADGAALICTSRVALGHPAETTVRLEPLDDLAARRLLERRLAAARGSQDDLDPDDVQRLLERLGGLPLAIELAAARARLLPLADLAARLEGSSRVLRAPAGGRDGRHSSLDRVLEDSWALLSPEVRSALARCSVFVLPFEVAAAEVVLAPVGPDPLALLEELEQQGLLRRDGETSRLMLLEVVRGFAAEKLELSGERPDAEARHRAWWTRRLADGEEHVRVVEEVVAAFSRALPSCPEQAGELLILGRPLLDRALPTDAWIDLLDRVLQYPEALAPPDRAALYCWRGRLHRRAGDADAAWADLERAAEEARAAGDLKRLAEALHARASARSVRGEGEEAVADMRAAREAWRVARDPAGEAMALGGEATVLLSLRLRDEAEARLREALAISPDLPYGTRVLLHNTLGNACLHAGRTEEAAEHYSAAAAALRGRGDPGRRAVVHNNLALTHLARRDLEAAEASFRVAIADHRRAGRIRSRGIAEGNLGRVRWLRGDPVEAERLLEGAAATLLRCGAPVRAAFFRLLLCMVHGARRRREAARFTWDRAREDAGDQPLPPAPRALAWAALALAQEDLERAREVLEAARVGFDPVLHPELEALEARIAAAAAPGAGRASPTW